MKTKPAIIATAVLSVAAMLAYLHGVAPLPKPPNPPKERVHYVLNDSPVSISHTPFQL